MPGGIKQDPPGVCMKGYIDMQGGNGRNSKRIIISAVVLVAAVLFCILCRTRVFTLEDRSIAVTPRSNDLDSAAIVTDQDTVEFVFVSEENNIDLISFYLDDSEFDNSNGTINTKVYKDDALVTEDSFSITKSLKTIEIQFAAIEDSAGKTFRVEIAADGGGKPMRVCLTESEGMNIECSTIVNGSVADRNLTCTMQYLEKTYPWASMSVIILLIVIFLIAVFGWHDKIQDTTSGAGDEKQLRRRRQLLAFIACLLAAGLVEVLFFNYRAVTGDRAVTVLSDGKQAVVTENNEFSFPNSFFDSRGDRENKYDITELSGNAQGKYIKKLCFDYADSESPYVILHGTEVKDGERVDFESEVSQLIKGGNTYTINVNAYIEDYTLEIASNTVTIGSVWIDNGFTFNWLRFFAVLCFLLFICFIGIGRLAVTARLENMFAITALCCGVLMIFVMPFQNAVSQDDGVHYRNAYTTSFFGSKVAWAESSYRFLGGSIEIVNTKENKETLEAVLNKEQDYTKPAIVGSKSKWLPTYRLSSLPSSVPMYFARKLGFSYVSQFRMGKLGNLLFYILIMYAAIKYCRVGKRFLTMFALMPTMIWYATQYTYDVTVNACMVLAGVLIMNEYLDRDKPISVKTMSAILIMAILGALPKQIYIPLILIMLFFPKTKFRNKQQMWIFRAGILVICGYVLSTAMSGTISDTVTQNIVPGDLRGGDTSASGQLIYMVRAPLKYAALLFSSIFKNLPQDFFSKDTLTFLGYNETYPVWLYWIFVIVYVFTALTDKIDAGLRKPGAKERVVVIVDSLIIGILIWTALYMSFTPVGAGVINGVQCRYFLPLVVPLSVLIHCDFLREKLPFLKKEAACSRWTVVFCACFLLIGIGQYIVSYNL